MKCIQNIRIKIDKKGKIKIRVKKKRIDIKIEIKRKKIKIIRIKNPRNIKSIDQDLKVIHQTKNQVLLEK